MSRVRVEPLCAELACQRPIAYTPSGLVSRVQFLSDVAALARRLPREADVLNYCQDRYRFMVGVAAALVAGRVSLLPASRTPETVRQLRQFSPDIVCLTDGGPGEPELEQVRCTEPCAGIDDSLEMPQIDESRVVALLFTAGSTGAPVAHRKTWGEMVRGARAWCAGLQRPDEGFSIVSTVPSQHMYGFETTVLLPLHAGCSVWSGRPFYPADIAATLARVPRPRMLVTTPFHLQSLLSSGVELPPLDRIQSATAPLSPGLAREAEAALHVPLYEIFGSTETGQIAYRRTTQSPTWNLMADVCLVQRDGRTFAEGGHVMTPTEVADVIELRGKSEFLLHGRNADLINIAGKRTSLAYLNHHLNSIELVEDGSFYCPPAAPGAAIERLCAFVVAPRLSPAQLLTALRERIEPVFLPRPLLFLDKLPRNDTGKLPRAELQALLDNYRSALTAGPKSKSA